MLWQLDVLDASAAPVVGTRVKAGEVIGYIQTFYGLEEVVSAADGVLAVVSAQQGVAVAKGEIIARIEKL
jgi:pyruvate carboxylase subunit B